MKKTFKIPATICANAKIHPKLNTQRIFAKIFTVGEAFSKLLSSESFSLNDLRYSVETIYLPNGKKLYLITGHKNGNSGKKIIPPIKYPIGTKIEVTNQIMFPKNAIINLYLVYFFNAIKCKGKFRRFNFTFFCKILHL